MNNQNSNIRRIDDLGRIVIPKDIRKKLKIKENEPLEIYIDSGEIKIKKYSILPSDNTYLEYIVDMANRITKNEYIIVDRTKVISSSKKDLENTNISNELEKYVLNGEELKNKKMHMNINDKNVVDCYANITPLLIEGDRAGSIIEYSETKEITQEYVIKIIKSIIEKNFNND